MGHCKQTLSAKFRNNLPKKPYCTNDFSKGIQIKNMAQAVMLHYLQYQYPNEMRWMVFDIDYPVNHEIIRNDLKLPVPNIIVQNRKNGHAHLYYLLAYPVHLNPDSSPKAIDYLLAVQRAMTRELGADPGYVGLLAKNPLDDEHWLVEIIHEDGYELDELADYLHTLNDKDAQEAIDRGIGFGRNVALFNGIRVWSYVEIRKYIEGTAKAWFEAVLVEATLNNTFAPPLYDNEVRTIAKSISSWTWRRRYELTDFGKQSARGKKRAANADMRTLGAKGGVVSRGGGRKSKKPDLLPRALVLREKGYTQQRIAQELGVGLRTLERWFSGG